MGNIQSIHRKRRRRPKSVVPGDIQNHASGLRRAFTRHQKRGSEQEQRPDDTSSSTPKPVAVDPNVYIKGRRYQNITPKYYMPNDEQEQDRLTNLVAKQLSRRRTAFNRPFYVSILYWDTVSTAIIRHPLEISWNNDLQVIICYCSPVHHRLKTVLQATCNLVCWTLLVAPASGCLRWHPSFLRPSFSVSTYPSCTRRPFIHPIHIFRKATYSRDCRLPMVTSIMYTWLMSTIASQKRIVR